MKDYTFIQPGDRGGPSGAVTLALAPRNRVVADLLPERGPPKRWPVAPVRPRRCTAYNAGLEVWREMATGADPRFQRVEAVAQRDSLGRQLSRRAWQTSAIAWMDDEDRQRGPDDSSAA